MNKIILIETQEDNKLTGGRVREKPGIYWKEDFVTGTDITVHNSRKQDEEELIAHKRNKQYK
jgi:hypothetical protein